MQSSPNWWWYKTDSDVNKISGQVFTSIIYVKMFDAQR